MQKTIIKYAINKTTQKVEHIDNVANGLLCHCICVECGNEMEAIQGEKREWHFRHRIDSKCKGGLETAIHKLAKEIIVNNSQITLPFQTLYYCDAKPEARFEDIIPDVSVLSDGKSVYIEIYVCHKVEPEKEKFYKNRELNSFEIDLSQVSYTTTVKEIEELVLRNPTNKKILYWEGEYKPIEIPSQSKNNKWWGWLAVIGILYYFLKKNRN